MPFKLHLFFAGMLIATAFRKSPYTASLYAALGVFLAILPIQGYLHEQAGRGVIVALFAFLIVGPKIERLAKGARALDDFLGRGPFKVLGELSCGVYLTHLLIMLPVMAILSKNEVSPLMRFVEGTFIVIGLSYGLAAFTYRFVEKPGIALGNSIVGRSALAASAFKQKSARRSVSRESGVK